MQTIDSFIEDLKYYRLVAKSQTDPDILKFELRDLIAETNDFLEELKSLIKDVPSADLDELLPRKAD